MYEIYRSGSDQKLAPRVRKNPPPASVTEPTALNRAADDYSEILSQTVPTTDMFRAFAPKPELVYFEAQAKTEKVLLLLRQHPIVLFKPIFILAAGLLFPPLVQLSPFLNFLPSNFQLAFVIGWYVAMTGMALQIFLVWFFNAYLITDERIIDVDFHSIIQKNVSSAKIDNIEDITVAANGAFASFFDYGTVLVQTAAEKNEFEFENVPQPTKVAKLLNELVLEEEREKLEGRVS